MNRGIGDHKHYLTDQYHPLAHLEKEEALWVFPIPSYHIPTIVQQMVKFMCKEASTGSITQSKEICVKDEQYVHNRVIHATPSQLSIFP